MTEIGDGSFLCCSGLTEIEVQEGNPVFDSRQGCNAIIRTKDNRLQVGCRNTVIPDDIKTIGRAAFRDCYELEQIVIPASVTEIGMMAFGHCSGLTSITSLNPTPPELERNAFRDVPGSCTIYVPKGCKAKYANAWGDATDFVYDDFVEM